MTRITDQFCYAVSKWFIEMPFIDPQHVNCALIFSSTVPDANSYVFFRHGFEVVGYKASDTLYNIRHFVGLI